MRRRPPAMPRQAVLSPEERRARARERDRLKKRRRREDAPRRPLETPPPGRWRELDRGAARGRWAGAAEPGPDPRPQRRPRRREEQARASRGAGRAEPGAAGGREGGGGQRKHVLGSVLGSVRVVAGGFCGPADPGCGLRPVHSLWTLRPLLTLACPPGPRTFSVNPFLSRHTV